jgi:NADPH:quinone reductase-like Zn-dependent oxidoreductase
VGTFAVQIAKSFGAEVTAVCSARNEDLVRSIGADHVIDYGRVDFARSSERYDVVVDNMYRPLTDLGRALAPEGTVALVGGSSGRWINGVGRAVTAPLWSAVLRRRMASFLAETTNEDLTALIELVEAGKVKPVIDRTYSLADAPEAIRYLEQGHVRGKVVITV